MNQTRREQVHQQIEDELKEQGNRNPEFWEVTDHLNSLTNAELLDHISNAMENLK